MMSKPAARVGDMHTCPMVTPGTPPVPHVGGALLPPGVPTVLIGGMPAATLGGMCVCVGPPDSIVLGSTGVLIGGRPAARMGDSTAHGGVIVAGCPTVLIGEVGVVAPGQPLINKPRKVNSIGKDSAPVKKSQTIVEEVAEPKKMSKLDKFQAWADVVGGTLAVGSVVAGAMSVAAAPIVATIVAAVVVAGPIVAGVSAVTHLGESLDKLKKGKKKSATNSLAKAGASALGMIPFVGVAANLSTGLSVLLGLKSGLELKEDGQNQKAIDEKKKKAKRLSDDSS